MASVISLINVSKVFKQGDAETAALDNITLNIMSGEFVAIMGPSGSGKSTLMNIIGLLDSPTSGEYSLDGETVKNRRDKALAQLRSKKIGFVFQSFNLLNRLSAAQNIELAMIYAGTKGKERHFRALELLELVGLKDRASYRPNQLSGGQSQRVAIARALANNPSLILADEPTGNLDSKSSKAIMKILHQLHRNGSTIVMVTHNPDLAAGADRIITIKDGKVAGIVSQESQ